MELDIQLHPKDCAKLPLLYIKIAGLWSIQHSNSMFKFLYNFYVVTVKFIHCYLLFGMIIKFFFYKVTIEEKMELISLGISECILFCKLWVFSLKEEEIRYLFNILAKNFFIHETYITTENRKIINSTLKFSRQLIISYAFIINFGITFYADFTPLVIASYNMNVNNEMNVTSVQPRKLPYSIWVPINKNTSQYYHLVYVILMFMGHSVGFVLISTQTSILTILICLRGQFQLLCDALRNIFRNVSQRLEANTDMHLRDDLNSTQTSHKNDISYEVKDIFLRESEQYLKKCIKYHQSLIKFTERLNLVWDIIFFTQFLTASLLMCFIGFQIMIVSLDANLIRMIMFMAITLFELGVLCKLGSDIMAESEDVYSAIYDNEWHIQSKSFKDSLRLVMLRAQKPARITAGKFGTLSLPLFAAILKSSYSYLALLRQFNEG